MNKECFIKISCLLQKTVDIESELKNANVLSARSIVKEYMRTNREILLLLCQEIQNIDKGGNNGK